MRRKRSKLFPPLFGMKHFCWTDFFETWIRAITQSIPFVSKRNQVFVPLPSWCTTDDMTDRQTDRQTHRKTMKACGTYSRLHLFSVVILHVKYLLAARSFASKPGPNALERRVCTLRNLAASTAALMYAALILSSGQSCKQLQVAMVSVAGGVMSFVALEILQNELLSDLVTVLVVQCIATV